MALLHQLLRRRCQSCPDTELKRWSPRRVMAHTRPRIMPDGTITYPRKGIEPPPDIVGYLRDPNDSFSFLPKWFACVFRVQNQYVKACGNVTIKSYCGNSEYAEGQGSEVTLTICEACILPKTFSA